MVSRCTFLVLFFAVFLSGCNSCQSSGRKPRPVKTPSSADVKAELEAETQFNLDLFRTLNKDENLVLSPLSVRLTLGMALAGARTETEKEMMRVLSILNPGSFPDLAATTLLGLPASNSDTFTFHIHQGAWGQKGLVFEPTFLNILSNQFASSMEFVDFATNPKQVENDVNSWIAKETHGMISQLLPENSITAQTKLILANAVYFKAKWEFPFQKDETKEKPFTRTDGTKVNASMMKSVISVPWTRLDSSQVIELPYMTKKISMILVLPDAHDGLSAIEKALTLEKLRGSLLRMKDQKLELSLPRFRLENFLDLRPILTSMGMNLAFDRFKADFSGMCKVPEVFLEKVYHQAKIDVDEEGTEASASTGSIIEEMSIPMTFLADHPFLFFILDKEHGYILFMGRVADPGKG